MTLKINFIKSKIEALPVPPPGKRTRVFDFKTRGLMIDITAKGSRTFYMRRKAKGRTVWERIGLYPDISIEQARGMAADINAQIAQGKDPREAKLEAKGEATLAELFEKYGERHVQKSRKTWPVMQKDFERNLDHWGNRPASSISMQDVEELHGTIGDKRGPYTANRTIQLLRAIYNKAIAWKIYKGDNPAARISLFPERPRERFLLKDEVKRLLTALETEQDDDLKAFVLMSLLTGARKSNVLSMAWKDIDFDEATWTIPETKNGTVQIVDLTAYELTILRTRKQTIKGEFVFPGSGKTRHLQDPKKAWARFIKRAEIENCTLHDLRRNLGTWMASQNINVALIKNALHHRDMKTTLAVYARTHKDAVRESRETAHRAMFKTAGFQLPNDHEP